MASVRQQTLAQLQRLNGPTDTLHHGRLFATPSGSPHLSAGPSPVSQLGHAGPAAAVSPCSTQVGARRPVGPSSPGAGGGRR